MLDMDFVHVLKRLFSQEKLIQLRADHPIFRMRKDNNETPRPNKTSETRH